MNRSDKAILTTAYLPPIDYFRIIANSENIEIERWENYQKQSYRSRCHILSANGPLSLTIPVNRSEGLSVPVTQVRIDYTNQWQKSHWRAIVSAYQSSPFFEYYIEDFRPYYEQKFDLLFDFNTSLTELLLKLTGINREIKFTRSFEKQVSEKDFRFSIHPKIDSPFQEENKKGRYHQVFAHKYDFIENLSVIDLLFNEGPDSISYLK